MPWHYLLVQAYDGVATAAYTGAGANYIFDVVTPPKRARCVAYSSLFTAVGMLLGNLGGALVGGLAPLTLPLTGVTIAEPFHLMLLASALVRLVANAALLGSFEEFRLRRPNFEPACATD